MSTANIVDLHPEFDLHEFVSAALQESDNPDADAIALEVARDVPDAVMRVALRQALVPYVKGVARAGRTKVQQAAQRDEGVRRAPRWADAAGLYLSLLMVRESLGDGKWKFLGDMTHDEVLAAAAARVKTGMATIEVGKRYKRIADAMEHHKVDVVGDLGQEALMGLFR